MGTDSWQNLVEMFFGQASRLGDAPMLWQKEEGVYQSASWREVAEDVARLAWSLEQAGVEAGDRVVIVSESRREWVIADLAIMAAGGISVPTYITNTTRDHTHILENSGAKAAVVSTRRLARALLPAAHESDSLQTAICMEPPNISQSLNVDIVLWEEAINNSQGEVADYEARAKEISR